MSIVQTIALLVVAVAGTAVVAAHDPLRETLLLGLFGLALTLLFFVLQAPDVALSEIVVSGVALPLIVLAALRKLHDQERAQQEDGAEDGS